MTTITINRATVEQVLEFCETVHGGCTDSDDGTVEAITVWCPELIDALRAALAQQAEPQITHSSECWRWHHKCAVAKIERECKHD